MSPSNIPKEFFTEEILARLRIGGCKHGLSEDGKTLYFYFSEGIGGFDDDDDDVEVTESMIEQIFADIIDAHPKELPWGAFEFAFTCSKMRPESFGGSVTFIHKTGGVLHTCTGAWLAEQRDKFINE